LLYLGCDNEDVAERLAHYDETHEGHTHDIEIAEDHNPKNDLFDKLEAARDEGNLNVLWERINGQVRKRNLFEYGMN